MNAEDRYDELVGLIYEAAVEPEQWQAVLLHLSDLFNGASTSLLVHDFENSRIHPQYGGGCIWAAGFDPAYLASYAEYYSLTNIWLKNGDLFSEGSIIPSSILYPDEMLPSTEYYTDWLRPQDLFFSLGVVVAKNGALAVNLSAVRSKNRGAFSEEDMACLKRLLPHLNRACQINQRLVHERLMTAQQLALGSAAQEVSGLCFWGLSANGTVLCANPRGEAVLREGRWLTLRQGGLHAADAVKDSELQLAFRNTVIKRRPHNLNLNGADGSPHCCLTLMPVPAFDALNLIDQRVAVIALLADGNGKRVATVQQLRDLFDLTPAEARLARALVHGEDIADYAKAEGVKKTTVRTQLQSAMHKTGAAKQKDLVRLVMSIPAVRERK